MEGGREEGSMKKRGRGGGKMRGRGEKKGKRELEVAAAWGVCGEEPAGTCRGREVQNGGLQDNFVG